MNWWMIMSQTETFFTVVTGSNPYTLSAGRQHQHQPLACDQGP